MFGVWPFLQVYNSHGSYYYLITGAVRSIWAFALFPEQLGNSFRAIKIKMTKQRNYHSVSLTFCSPFTDFFFSPRQAVATEKFSSPRWVTDAE